MIVETLTSLCLHYSWFELRCLGSSGGTCKSTCMYTPRFQRVQSVDCFGMCVNVAFHYFLQFLYTICHVHVHTCSIPGWPNAAPGGTCGPCHQFGGPHCLRRTATSRTLDLILRVVLRPWLIGSYSCTLNLCTFTLFQVSISLPSTPNLVRNLPVQFNQSTSHLTRSLLIRALHSFLRLQKASTQMPRPLYPWVYRVYRDHPMLVTV